jgi:hypothetical protein
MSEIESTVNRGLIHIVELDILGRITDLEERFDDHFDTLFDNLDSAISWCISNLGENRIVWQEIGDPFYFKNLDTAMLFKLTWG